MAFFLFFASMLFGILLVWPYAIYPAIAKVIARKWPAPHIIAPAEFPLTDIVLCGYNEEGVIGQKIDSCLAIAERYGNITVHVYSDGSSDRTPDIIRGYGDRIDGVIAIDRNGKSVGMNSLLARCSGELVVFTDANVMLDENLFANIPRHFRDADVGCIVGNLVYVNKAEGDVASIGAGYWSFEERLKMVESQSGSTVGADGSIFAIRRSLFREVPRDIIDDMFTSLSILCAGHRVIQVDDVRAYERASTNSGEEFRRKVRIACRCFNCHRLIWPQLRRLAPLDLFKYLSHKLVRWLGGFWIVGGAVTWTSFCITVGWSWLALLSLALFTLTLCSGLLKLRFLDAPREMLMSVLAASWGVCQSLRGKRFQTWTIAASTRSPAQSK